MRQNIRNAAIITLIVAIIVLISVVAVVIEQGSHLKIDNSSSQYQRTVQQSHIC